MLLQILIDTTAFLTVHQNEALLAAVLISSGYLLVIRPFLVSPLRNIPGPYLNRISHIPSLTAQRRFRGVRWVHELHRKYGNVVVISPSAISCNGDSKYISDIYGKNMPKTRYYENFKFHGEVNMFCELNDEKHLALKRIILGIYLKSLIFRKGSSHRKILLEKVFQLVRQVGLTSTSRNSSVAQEEPRDSICHPSNPGSGCLEVHSLFGSFGMDVVSAVELGITNGTHLLEAPKHRFILNNYRLISSMVFWTTQFPRFWSWIASTKVRKAAEELETWHLALYKEAENLTMKTDLNNASTLEAFKRHHLTGAKAYSNITDNLVAGHDTTATQLTYLCYELSRPHHNSYQTRLQGELLQAFGKPESLEDNIQDIDLVDKLCFLDALVKENLRVHLSTRTSEPRQTNRPYELCVRGRKVVIRPGVGISCQPYLMHRNSEVFLDPEVWKPERWLQNECETLQQYRARVHEMQRHMMPFGRGVRMCLGLNLAVIEIKLALVNLYWHFQLGLCLHWGESLSSSSSSYIKTGGEFSGVENDVALMTKRDSYITGPAFDECWLNWSHK